MRGRACECESSAVCAARVVRECGERERGERRLEVECASCASRCGRGRSRERMSREAVERESGCVSRCPDIR